MIDKLKTWQLICAVILAPPIGAYCVCRRKDIGNALKILSAAYAAIVILLLLIFPALCSGAVIDAERLQGNIIHNILPHFKG